MSQITKKLALAAIGALLVSPAHAFVLDEHTIDIVSIDIIASATKECKSDKPCDKPTLAECKQDLLDNVCPKPERTCPTLYFDWNGKEYSVTCPKRPRPSYSANKPAFK